VGAPPFRRCLPGPQSERIDGRHTWGLTPIDAALCRMGFYERQYEGIYTLGVTRPMWLSALNVPCIALETEEGDYLKVFALDPVHPDLTGLPPGPATRAHGSDDEDEGP